MNAKSCVDLLALAPPFLEKKSIALSLARVVHDVTVLTGSIIGTRAPSGSQRLLELCTAPFSSI